MPHRAVSFFPLATAPFHNDATLIMLFNLSDIRDDRR